jgi:FKBP-type peptidyl-prolyl cis-trans isomerase
MQKTFALMIQILAAGMLLAGYAPAQTPPATPPQTTPAKPASPAKTAPASAAKKPAAKTTATPLTLKTQKEKASYALGMNIGTGLHKQGVPVDPALVSRGLRDAMAGAKLLLTEDEMKAAITQLQGEVRQAQQAKAHEAGLANRKEGDAFLAANKSKEGVTALPSGMQYKILKAGTGPKPVSTDTVTCNYKGTLLNGKEFDSSYKRGEPASFQVGGVIKGWTEALQLMPVGSKWQLFIPADLAYGDRGAPPDIAPGDTLIFEVELLSIGEPKKDEPKANEPKDNDMKKDEMKKDEMKKEEPQTQEPKSEAPKAESPQR